MVDCGPVVRLLGGSEDSYTGQYHMCNFDSEGSHLVGLQNTCVVGWSGHMGRGDVKWVRGYNNLLLEQQTSFLHFPSTEASHFPRGI